MRKIMFCAALVVASLCTIATLSAQSTNVKSVTFHHAGIKEIHATVPTCITVANDTSDAIEIGSVALRAQAAMLILHAPITCTIFLMQALGKSFRAVLLACARQGFFFVPLILFVPRFLGVEWVIFVQPFADLLTFLLTLPFMVFFFQKTREKAFCRE